MRSKRREFAYPNYRIVIVDNASDNESETVLKESFPRHLVLQAGRNGGYAAGNNVGIRRGIRDGADFFLILNNDTVVEPDFISVLVAHALDNPQVGLSGPLIRQTNGELYRMCARRRPRLRDVFWDKGIGRWLGGGRNRSGVGHYYQEADLLEAPREVDVLSGACMLLRAGLVEEIGLLDENTFLFGEEFILHEKIRNTRFTTVIVPQSRIVHKGGQSIRTMGTRATLAYLRSLNYYLREYRGVGIVPRGVILFSAAIKVGPGIVKTVSGYRKLMTRVRSTVR